MYLSNGVCRSLTWLCGYDLSECQVLHELNLSHYIITCVFGWGVVDKEALMNFLGQL